MQSRKMSIVETITSTCIGLVVSFFSNLFIFWALGISIPMHQNIIMVAFFTLVSLVRGYLVRRLFNHLEAQKQKAIDEHEMNIGIGGTL